MQTLPTSYNSDNDYAFFYFSALQKQFISTKIKYSLLYCQVCRSIDFKPTHQQIMRVMLLIIYEIYYHIIIDIQKV